MSAAAGEENKKQRWRQMDDAMRQLLREMRDKELAIDLPKPDPSINPDKQANKISEDLNYLLKKVSRFIEQEFYPSAEALLKHIYRICPVQEARRAISSARRICHEYVVQDNKWVKRRATLRRRGEDSATIRAERKKYRLDKSDKLKDYLTTALLEINEGVERRSGNFFASLPSQYEVILPPIMEDEKVVFSKAPLMFQTKRSVDTRRFQELMHTLHDIDPGLKSIERNFYVAKYVPIVGFKVELSTDKLRRKATRLVSSKMRRNISLGETRLVHGSSKLIWYTYDFPIETSAMHFADMQIADSYEDGKADTPFLELNDGKLSRDAYVKLRDAARVKEMQERSNRLKELRERFELDNSELLQQIKNLTDVQQELSEILSRMRVEFTNITSTALDGDNSGNGLTISQYKRLYGHFQAMYQELCTHVPEERDRLYWQLFEERMKARVLYYEYRDLVKRRSEYKERIDFLTQSLADRRNIARGTGKSLLKPQELVLDTV